MWREVEEKTETRSEEARENPRKMEEEWEWGASSAISGERAYEGEWNQCTTVSEDYWSGAEKIVFVLE